MEKTTVPQATGSVLVAAIQFSCSNNTKENIAKAKRFIGEAASAGANIILLQELFSTLYFCQEPCEEYFSLAVSLNQVDDSFLSEFQSLAKELYFLLVFFFERCNQVFYNSVIIFDADGSCLGVYRKSHIPESPGYYEKFFFSPGDTGFRCFSTLYGVIGVGICWDQWFPECARIMALLGADILFYPTAIGSEPQDSRLDSRGHWQRTMQGHAAANMIPLVASNRVGVEYTQYTDHRSHITFYGSSLIVDATGEIKIQADSSSETFICYAFDLAAIRKQRAAWGLFRDRRPDLYALLGTRDGQNI
ncbi:N-carbamoylputrescine amidase [Galdieria sulphuraria]|nr:N-carbamoylputrescine amidase [Galdieria sulphuraria]